VRSLEDLVSICADLAASISSAGQGQIETDDAVGVLESITAVLRHVRGLGKEDLQQHIARRVASGREDAAALAEFVGCLDLTFTTDEYDPVWFAAPSRPAFISRKLAVLPCGIGLRQAREHEEAAHQASTAVRWEVSDAIEAARAERVFRAIGSKRLDVRVVEAESDDRGDDRRLIDAIADAVLWLQETPDDRLNIDLAVALTEQLTASLSSLESADRQVVIRRLREREMLIPAGAPGGAQRAIAVLISDIESLADDSQNRVTRERA
jgi:hypothetical protein